MNKDLIILSLKNDDNSISRFLVYKYEKEEEKDYLVIGNVDKLYYSEKIELLKRIIKEIKELLKIENKEQFYEKLKTFKNLPGINEILFTQEGFDLLNGKHMINNEIPKTINIEYEIEDNIIFGNTYELDATNKIDEING